MGAVQGGADNTRAAAAETAQKRRKRRGRQKAVPQLKEGIRRTGGCSSDRGKKTDSLRHVKRSHRSIYRIKE